MPNIASLLKDEIKRLSRREIRANVGPARRTWTQQRRALAALKRQFAELSRRIARLERGASRSAPAAQESEAQRHRFVAKGLQSHRARLGLSAIDFGRLVGVSAQTIYNWEHGATRPRGAQLAALAALRGIGKREAQARLAQLGGNSGKRRAKAAKRAKKR